MTWTKYKFVVIEEANTDPAKDANWADTNLVLYQDGIYVDADRTRKEQMDLPSLLHSFVVAVKTKRGPFRGWKKWRIERIRKPAFEKGEILIVDEHGREVGPFGRKPWKWQVRYREFDDLEEAVKYAHKLVWEGDDGEW